MPGRDGKGPSWGNGLGRGRGKDRGSGRDFGMGIGQGMFQRNIFDSIIPHAVQPQLQSSSQQSLSKEQELDLLKQQAQVLQRHADSILHRINELNMKNQNISDKGSSVKASVIIEKCIGCGICLDFCNRGAITLDNVAIIDLEKCTGCGTCVDTCPNEALVLR